MLHIHHYRIHILCTPGPDLYIADWLSQRNYIKNMDQEITRMNINMHVISTSVNIPAYSSVEDIQVST